MQPVDGAEVHPLTPRKRKRGEGTTFKSLLNPTPSFSGGAGGSNPFGMDFDEGEIDDSERGSREKLGLPPNSAKWTDDDPIRDQPPRKRRKRAKGAPKRITKRFIAEQTVDHGVVVDEEVEDDEEEMIDIPMEVRVPGYVSIGEADSGREHCVGCRLLKGTIPGVGQLDGYIFAQIDDVMQKGMRTGGVASASLRAQDIYRRLVYEPCNRVSGACRSKKAKKKTKTQLKVPMWTAQSIQKHYEDNHADDPSYPIKHALDRIHRTAAAIERHDLYYTRNDGPPAVDPVSGKVRRARVTHVNMHAAKLIETLSKSSIQMMTLLQRQRAAERRAAAAESKDGKDGGRGGNSRNRRRNGLYDVLSAVH